MKVLTFLISIFLFFLPFSDQIFAQKSELAWVIGLAMKYQVVRVETVESKILIDFQIQDSIKLLLFTQRIGGLATVSFDCVKDKNGNCNFVFPFLSLIDGENVEITRWEFLKTSGKALVHHGPGDKKKGSSTEIIGEIASGSKSVWFHLKITDIRKTKTVSKIKRDDAIDINFPTNQPRKAFVKGVEMDIVAIIL